MMLHVGATTYCPVRRVILALEIERCVACRSGSPEITEQETANLLPQIPDWSIIVDDNGKRLLERQFTFRNFIKPMEFAILVVGVSEQQWHHPRIMVEWGKLTVSWSTYAIGGLHRNDFIMASKTDSLFDGFQ